MKLFTKKNFLFQNELTILKKNNNFHVKTFHTNNLSTKNIVNHKFLFPYFKNIFLIKSKNKNNIFFFSEKFFHGKKLYQEIYRNSIEEETRNLFWENESKEISWYEKFNKVLDEDEKPFYKWFKGGKINMYYNCIDRHIETGKGENIAYIWESAYLHKSVFYSYNEVEKQVKKITKILIGNNINKGDRVVIYMPMIPEAIFSMLACAKIGAIHSVVFGGFAVDELANRINDSKPKMIITSSAGVEPKKIIPYFPIVKESLKQVNFSDRIKILFFPRDEVYKETDPDLQNHITYNENLLNNKPYSTISENQLNTIPLSSNDPLYILYTSGTTGTPKGILRDIGGTCVALNYSLKTIMNIGEKDVFFATSDIGWVVGHSYIVYGPLIRGATSILYEGKPVGTPNAEKYWEMIEKFKIKSIFTSPTAMRSMKREDPSAKLCKKYSLDSLESVHIAGERCDPDTLFWTEQCVGNKILINDNWWQTETGWPICSNNLTIYRFPTIPGSAGMPIPGYNIKIVDLIDSKNEENEKEYRELNEPLVQGNIFIKLPMPPSFMLTLWGNDEGFIKKYLSHDKKYYITGDAGYFDEDEYLHILNRTDDVINVAGHRLSTGRMEEVIMQIPEITEAALIGLKDEIKGEVPFGFIVLNLNIDGKDLQIVNEIKKRALDQVVLHIGAISRIKDLIVLNKLPKTRSGKIVRGLIKKIVNKQYYEVPNTLEDKGVLEDLIEALKKKEII